MLFEYFILGFYFIFSLPYMIKLKALTTLNFNWFIMIMVGLSLHYFLFFIILKIKKIGKITLTLFFLCSYAIYMSSLFLFNYKMDTNILLSALENETEMIFYFVTPTSILLVTIITIMFYFILTKIKFDWNINKYPFIISFIGVLILSLFTQLTKNRTYLISYPIIDCFDLFKLGRTIRGYKSNGGKIIYEKNDLNKKFSYNMEDDINVIFVVGESERNDFFTKYTPRLEKMGVLRFNKSKSEYFYTRLSVPEMLTLKTENGLNFSIVDIMNSLGFRTHWIGAQSIRGGNDSPYSYFALNCKNRVYKDSNRTVKNDFELLDYLDNFLYNNGKNFYIIHIFGSHVPFFKRFDNKHIIKEKYCKVKDTVKCSSEELSNAYINSIDYADDFLSQILEKFKDKKTIFFFTSDHAVDTVSIDETQDIKTVPAIMWFNNINYDKEYILNNMKKDFHHTKAVSNLLNCIGIESDYINKNDSVCK